MTLFLLVKGLNSVTWMSEPLLIGEMAPTSTRNMFYGCVAFVGEIGSITAPYFGRLVSLLIKFSLIFIDDSRKQFMN